MARKPKDPLSSAEVQQIIATIFERVTRTDEHAGFRIAPIEHAIVAKSRLLIDAFHISADDALHVFTGWVYDCDHFLIHDNKIVHRLKAAPIEGMKIIDLGDENDRAECRKELNL